MGKFFSGLLVWIVAGVIAVIVGAATAASFTASLGDADVFMNLILVIPLFIVFTWIFSVPLGKLSHFNPVAYFGLCLIGSIVLLILELQNKFNTGVIEQDLGKLVGLHSALVFIIVPKINSETEDYLVTETTYLDGEVVGIEEYISTYYMSGSFAKFVLVCILGIIGGYFTYRASTNADYTWAIWATFVIEGGFSLFKTIQSFKAMSDY